MCRILGCVCDLVSRARWAWMTFLQTKKRNGVRGKRQGRVSVAHSGAGHGREGIGGARS